MAKQRGWRVFSARVWATIALIFSLTATAWALSPQVQNGVTWLVNQVNTTGSLTNEGTSIGAPLQNRDEAARTIKQLSPSSPIPDVTQDDYSATEYLAREIASLHVAGTSTGTQLTTLVAQQNADGGFGSSAGYPSDALSSVWALYALSSQASAFSSQIAALKTWLYGQVGPDGGLAAPSATARIEATSVFLLALENLPPDLSSQSVLVHGGTWLAQQQTADGAWGESLFLTGYALSAMEPLSADATMQQAASSYLLTQQVADGSWADDPIVSAVVLRALSRMGTTPVISNSVGGQVFSIASGNVLPSVTVAVAGSSVSTTTDDNGNFLLSGLPAGSDTLTLSLSGYQPISLVVSVPSSGVVNVGALALVPATGSSTLSGTVTDAASKKAISGATVAVTVGSTVLSATSDANGNYQVNNIPAGSASITVSASGYTSVTAVTTTSSTGGSLVFQPVMYAVGTSAGGGNAALTGQVLAQGTNQPLANVQVIVNGTALTSTDSSGNYSLSLAAGSYTVSYQIAGYASASTQIVATSGEIANLQTVYLSIQATTTTISGTVTDSLTQKPIAGATVQVIGVASTITDANGQYTLANLSGSTFSVRVSATGYNSQVEQLQVSQPMNVVGNFALVGQSGQGIVISPLTANPTSAGLNTPIWFTTTYQNTGSTAQNILVQLDVFDSSGNLVAIAPAYISIGSSTPDSNITLAAGTSQPVYFMWNTAQTAPGSYTVVANAVQAGTVTEFNLQGTIVAQGSGSFDISPQLAFASALSANPPVEQASATSPITISGVLQNKGNIDSSSGQAVVNITDSSHTVVASLTASVPAMPVQNIVTLNLGNWTPTAAGNYTVTLQNPDGSQGGSTSIYVGPAAMGTFTVNPSVTGTGTQTVQGHVALQGVNSIGGTVTNPLAVLIKSAAQNAMSYTYSQSANSINYLQCLACHNTQAALAVAASNASNIPTDSVTAAGLLTNLKLDQDLNGGFIEGAEHYFLQPAIPNAWGLWAITRWPNTADVVSEAVQSANYAVSIQASSGQWSNMDNNTVGQPFDSSVTALNVAGLETLVKMLETNPGLTVRQPVAPVPVGNANAIDDGPHSWTQDENGTIYCVINVSNNRYFARMNADGSFTPLTGYVLYDVVVRGGIAYAIGNGGNYLYEYNISQGTLKTVLFPNSLYFSNLTIDSAGNFYAVSQPKAGGWAIYKFNASAQVTEMAHSSVTLPHMSDFKVGPQGQYYFTDRTSIYQVGSDGSSLNTLAKAAALIITSLDIDKEGRLIVSSAYQGLGVLRLESDGTMTVIDQPTGTSTTTLMQGALQQADGSYISQFVSNVSGVGYQTQLIRYQPDTPYASTAVAGFDASYRTSLANAWTYFQAHVPASTDKSNFDMAWAMVTAGAFEDYFSYLGQSANVQRAASIMSSLVAIERGRQNKDGGWPDPVVFPGTDIYSDPTVTATVGYGLSFAGLSPNDSMITAAVNYALTTQESNGTWNSPVDTSSNEYIMPAAMMSMWLPIEMTQLGQINADFYLTVPSTTTLANPTLVPSNTTANSDGSTQYHWNFANLTAAAQNIDFDLTLANLLPNEVRPVASDAHLVFNNSFNSSAVTAPVAVPSVTASAGEALTVATSQTSYGANAPVSISANVSNVGVSTDSGSVHIQVYAGDGTLVADLGSQTFSALASNTSDALTADWNTALLLPGSYYVQATLLDANSNVVSTQRSNFAIASSSATGAIVGAGVTTDKASYGPQDTVNLDDRVTNLTNNTLVGPLNLETVVTGPAGSVFWSHQDTVQQMVPGGLKDIAASIPLNTVAAGTYNVSLTVTDSSGATQASASNSFTVQSSAVSGAGVGGALTMSGISLSGHNLIKGDVLGLNESISNSGNAALSNVVVTTTVLDPVANTPVMQWTDTVASLDIGASAPLSHSWPSVGNYGQSLVIVVQSSLTGSKALAQSVVTLVKPPVTIAYSSDKSGYSANGTATLSTHLTSTTPIPLSGLSLVEQVSRPDGSVLWQLTVPSLSLAIDGGLSRSDQVALGTTMPGNYVATISLIDSSGAAITQSTASFSIVSTAQDGAGLSAGTPTGLGSVQSGSSTSIAYTVTDNGNVSLSNLPAQMIITNASTGAVIATLPTTLPSVPEGGSASGSVSWNSLGTNAGVPLQATLQVQVGSGWITLNQQAFSLVLPPVTATTIGVAATGYAYDDSISTSATVNNQSVVSFSPATVNFTLTAPDGTVLNTATASPVVPAGSTVNVPYSYTLSNAAPGSYTLSTVVSGNGQALSTTTTTIVVTSTADTGAGVSGALTGLGSIQAGSSASIGYSVADSGNASLSNAPVQILITNAATGQVVATLPTTLASLAMGGTPVSGSLSWSSLGITSGTPLSATLQVQVTQGWVTLAQQAFSLVLPPVATSISGVASGYAYNGTVNVTASVNNESVVSFTPGSVVFTLTGPTGTVVNSSTATPAPNLPAGATTSVPYSYSFGNAAPGSYSLSAVVSGNGETLSSASTTIVVTSTADTGAGLTGTLSNSPTAPYLGQTVVIGEVLSDAGNAALANLPVTLTVSQGSTLIQTWTDTLASLAMGGSQNLSHNWVPGAQGNYTETLTATVGGHSLTLATQPLTIAPPPVKLSVHTGWGGQARVLVYLGSGDQDAHEQQCGTGNGKQTANCLAPRIAAIKTALDALGVEYTVVSSQDDFVRAFRSGHYNNEWLLGVVNGLPDALINELAEAVDRGDSLVVDDAIQSWNNHGLYGVAGVTFRGHLNYRGVPAVAFQAPVYGSSMSAYNPLVVSVGDLNRPLYFQPATTATQTAAFAPAPDGVSLDGDNGKDNNGNYPALVNSRYGQGHTLAMAFDLVGSLLGAGNAAAWQEMLRESLADTTPDSDGSPTAVVPGAWLHADVVITNEADAVNFVATVQLPAGASYVGSQPAGTVNSDSSISIPVSLPVNAVVTLGIDFRAPLTAGSYTVTTAITPTGFGSPYGTYSQSFGVEATSQRLNDVTVALKALSPASPQDSNALRAAQKAYATATGDAGSSALSDALVALGESGSDLGAITGIDPGPARLPLDFLLQDWAYQWWQSCGSASGPLQGSCAP